MCLLGAWKLNVMVLNALIDMYEKWRIKPYILRDSYCITPRMNYYICIVDLLSHARYPQGHLNFTTKIPIKTKLGAWMYLFYVCKSNIMILSALIDHIYEKYRRIHKAHELFNKIIPKIPINLWSWILIALSHPACTRIFECSNITTPLETLQDSLSWYLLIDASYPFHWLVPNLLI